MNDSATKLTKKDIDRMTARRYLADKAYALLLGINKSARLRQIVKGLDMPFVTSRLIRDVMAESERFETVDRRWAVSARFGDTQRPFERIVTDIMKAAGVPLSVEVVANELAQVFERPVDYYMEALPKFFRDPSRYFKADENVYGLASWLVDTSSDDEEDIIFDNFISEEQVAHFSEICPAVDWDVDAIADSAAKVVNGCKEAIPMKVLALFAWRSLGPYYDPIDFYTMALESDEIIILSDQKAYAASCVKGWTKTLEECAQELAELPMEPEEEDEGPITVTDTDKEEMVNMVLAKGSMSAEDLLDAVMEVSPEDSGYADAAESLSEMLKADERVMWLGGSRWGKIVTFPEEVQAIPESLVVPVIPVFETPEGDVFDQEIEEDGFDGDLKSAIYNPLAEDVTDEDPANTMYQENGDTQRCVLKYHHKMEGTFPMCQINPDFFGVEPEIIPITLIDEGKRKTVYVNNATRLIYGLRDFYKDITEVSGAVFYFEKTANPGEYRFRYDGELDGQHGIDTSRSLELLDLKARYESSEMPVYDVIKEVLSKQGMTFPQIVDEVNIVKRCSRLLIASILSSYHTFHTRGKSDIWQFDSKKESQGFNKAKRKYIKK